MLGSIFPLAKFFDEIQNPDNHDGKIVGGISPEGPTLGFATGLKIGQDHIKVAESLGIQADDGAQFQVKQNGHGFEGIRVFGNSSSIKRTPEEVVRGRINTGRTLRAYFMSHFGEQFRNINLDIRLPNGEPVILDEP